MNDKTPNKFTKIIGSLGISVGITELIVPFVLMGANPLVLISSMIGGTIALWPITYTVANKLIKRREDREQRVMRCAANVFAMEREIEEKDKTYCQTTTNFLEKIYQKEEETGMKCSSNLCVNINSFLYLINANYYEEIAKYLKDLNREELINMLLEQIFLYLEDNKTNALKNEDAEVILKNCYFLKDELKEKIRNEYHGAEVNLNGFIDHSIINKRIDVLNEKEYMDYHQEEIPKTTIFDIEDIKSYKIIVEGMREIDNYLCNFGDISVIEWDYEALQKVVCIITKEFRKELVKQRDDYTEFGLTTSLAYNAMAYAVLNKKKCVSYLELLNTFKEWNYIAYDLRCIIANHLKNKLDIPNVNYPLNMKKSSYSKRKIVDFNQFKQENNY